MTTVAGNDQKFKTLKHEFNLASNLCLLFSLLFGCFFSWIGYKNAVRAIDKEMLALAKSTCIITKFTLGSIEDKLNNLLESNELKGGANIVNISGANIVLTKATKLKRNKDVNTDIVDIIYIMLESKGKQMLAIMNLNKLLNNIAGKLSTMLFRIHLIPKDLPYSPKKELYLYSMPENETAYYEECSYKDYDIAISIMRADFLLKIISQCWPVIISNFLVIFSMICCFDNLRKKIIYPLSHLTHLAKLVRAGKLVTVTDLTIPEFEPIIKQLMITNKLCIEVDTLGRQLTEKEAEEKSLYNIKSTFIACISHELRTPLNIIKVSSEMMKLQRLGPIYNEKYVEYSENMYNASNILLSVISTILDISRIEAGILVLDKNHVNLRMMLEGVIQQILENKPKQTIEFFPCDVPCATLDKKRIQGSFVNIISALLNNGNGHVAISITNKDNKLVSISLACTQLKPEQLACLIFKFDQSKDTMGAKFTNEDLSILLAQQLIKALSGDIAIEVKDNSEFRISIHLIAQQMECVS